MAWFRVDVWVWFHVDVWAWFHAAGTTKRDVYFPEGRWFDWYNQSVATETGGTTLNLPTPVDHIQVYICTCVHVHDVYMLMRGRKKVAKQHSTPKAVTFPELPQVGLEPTTLYTLDRVLYHVNGGRHKINKYCHLSLYTHNHVL